jgi:nucleotide-binding universal stress UspA family protein
MMFNDVIVGVGDYEAGRDAVALARALAASGRPLTLAYVEVVGPKRVPRSEAAWPEADCRRARKWLALLGDELRVDAEPVCVESHSVAKGLRTLAATEDADLLVIGASRRDEYERLLIGDDTREVLDNPGCAVAVAPVGYASRPSRLKKIGIGYDGSPASERALAVGRRLVRDLGVSLSASRQSPCLPRVTTPGTPSGSSTKISRRLVRGSLSSATWNRRQHPAMPPRRSRDTGHRSTCWSSARTSMS